MPPNRPFFLTGNATFDGNFWIAVHFPKTQDNWAYSAFLGALENMGFTSAWLDGGESNAEDAAALFRWIYNNGLFDMAWDIGDVKFTTAEPRYATWLLCDGTLYVDTDYPDLYARIGTTYNQGGDPSGHFRVPDMRGRVAAMTNNSSGVLPSWADAPGGTGGESTHQLTVMELASHTHADAGHVHGGIPTFIDIIALTGEEPVSLEVPLVSTNTATGFASLATTGGDTAHNTVQPTMALACYILAAF
jgi:microcystin-dependent protein